MNWKNQLLSIIPFTLLFNYFNPKKKIFGFKYPGLNIFLRLLLEKVNVLFILKIIKLLRLKHPL